MIDIIRKIFESKLDVYGKFQITSSSLIYAVLIILFYFIIIIIIKIIKNIIYKIKNFDEAQKYTSFTLLKYILLIVMLSSLLSIFGINLSVLLIGSSAILVGVGLGLQNLFNDYISGIIILLDSTVKVGDVIETNNIICTIQKINLRTTKAITREDKYIILPNSILTKSEIINWTHSKKDSRFEISIGISYNSDIEHAMSLMIEAANEHEKVNEIPQPIARVSNFLDSSVELTLLFWLHDTFRAENYKSQIRLNIFKKFKNNNIEIPFPQVVIHKTIENKR